MKPPPRRPEGFPGQRLVIVPPEIAVQASRQPITRDLCVSHIGAFVAAGGHHVERTHGTSQHILIGCVSGSGSCTLAGQDWNLESGDLLFLPPRQHHVYQASRNSPWTIFWIHFRGLRADDHLANLGVSIDQPVIRVDDAAVMTDAFEDIFRHATHGFGPAAMTGLSTSFGRLLGLAKVHQRFPGSRSRISENRLLKALALMRERLSHPWTLEGLASEAGMSIPHFTELCRQQTGMPPLALLIRLRLLRAMDLLQQGNHNVAEAGLAVGYEDPFYFSRLFRKHMGVPPSSCRQGP
jgi:AraC-like DNA-binding protein/mannose-6-phosphate isomerase-like protein (cupin superfamily)